eukprot:365651-Chlamydomonas_euryale.AAC.9
MHAAASHTCSCRSVGGPQGPEGAHTLASFADLRTLGWSRSFDRSNPATRPLSLAPLSFSQPTFAHPAATPGALLARSGSTAHPTATPGPPFTCSASSSCSISETRDATGCACVPCFKMCRG